MLVQDSWNIHLQRFYRCTEVEVTVVDGVRFCESGVRNFLRIETRWPWIDENGLIRVPSVYLERFNVRSI